MNNINIASCEGYDVLIYISDQHTADVAGFMGNGIIRTPHLDKIAKNSFVFNNAYTSCPLCVPARASFLTGQLPSNLNVFDNASDFKSGDVTFAHSFALKGYDTNLIGRMHFIGLDHFHGFTRRYAKDMTSSYWGCASENRKELGDFGRSLYQKHCLELVGSGDSPILAYDRDVVSHALEFYSQDYDKPQMTVVGTYSPHFSYIAPSEIMEHYRDKLKALYKDEIVDFNLPPIDAKVQKTSKEDIIELRAAYYAMVEIMDEQIGAVYEKYMEYLKRNNRKGIFVYMSDHGDQLGCMGIYGKQTFFEKSARIPLLISVEGVNGSKIDDAVSIMDIGQTLCLLCGADVPPLSEGIPFIDLMKGEHHDERYAISEFYDNQIKPCIRGYMVFKDFWKYIVYEGYENKELLFDLRRDRSEYKNIACDYPNKLREMRNLLKKDSRVKNRTEEYFKGIKNHLFLNKVGKGQTDLNIYMYNPPEEAIHVNESCKRAERDW